MMELQIFQNNKSIKPCAVVRSWADLVNWLEMHKEVALNCSKIRETGDKVFKNNLPALMPMGNIGDKVRKKENCVPTGLVMVDIDGKVKIDKEVASMDFGNLKPELQRLHVMAIHITPSGMGLRLLAHCHADGMPATIERLSNDLKLSAYGNVDPACKDLSRLSYLVPWEDWIYTDEKMFDEVPKVSLEQMEQYKSTGIYAQEKPTLMTLFDISASDEEWKNFTYNDVPVAQIAKEFIASTGGEPAEGTRHTFYNEMVVNIRNICDNNPKIVHAVLPTFGLPVEETWKQCESLCSSNRSRQIPLKLYIFLKEKGYLAERFVEVEDEKQEEVKEELPPIPSLPPIFKQFVTAAPPDFKIPTIVALLPILGTLCSHLRASYFDGSEQSTEFISLLFAPPSSGKSFIKRLSVLLQNLRDRDEISNAREELYAMSERKKGANEKGQDAPRVSVRIVKPLISIPELLTKMRYNQGHHMYIEVEELDTFSKGNKSAGGDKSDLWRVTWDNGYYGQYYKSVQTFKGEVQMFLNILFTSTQDQIDRFFKNVEDGLVTRFSVCPIENQQFAKFVPWKTISKKDQAIIDNVLARLEAKNYKVPLRFDKSSLYEIKPEEFDAYVPWQFEFQPFEYADLSYLHKPLLKWLEDERLKAASEVNPARDVFRRRAAVKAFRLGLVCHGMYKQITKKEREVITNFAVWFATIDLRNSLYQFGKRYNELVEEKDTKSKGINFGVIFSKLPDPFTITDLRVQCRKSFIKSPVKQIIMLWRKNKLISKVDVDKFKKN